MAYNYYRTIYVQASFSAGLAIGTLRSHLVNNNSGCLTVGPVTGGYVEIEICTYNSAVMAYAEDQLAAFV
jgi:hypothetical protein